RAGLTWGRAESDRRERGAARRERLASTGRLLSARPGWRWPASWVGVVGRPWSARKQPSGLNRAEQAPPLRAGSWLLRSLRDLAGSQAPRADANAFDAAAIYRSHGLQIRFEPPRAHVVRVTDLTADDGSLSAHCAT